MTAVDWAAMERHGRKVAREGAEDQARQIVAELHGRSLCRCPPTEESYACPDAQHEEMHQAVVSILIGQAEGTTVAEMQRQIGDRVGKTTDYLTALEPGEPLAASDTSASEKREVVRMSDVCDHSNVRRAERPVPDWHARCPDCQEWVGLSSGSLITIRERNEQVAQDRRDREAAPEALRVRQEAIDTALSWMRGSEYVGGPSVRDAWRKALEVLGPFETLHTSQAIASSTTRGGQDA